MVTICDVPVKEEKLRELFEGSYEDYLRGINELAIEIQNYKARKALERAIFSSRPVDKEVIKKIFKSGDTHVDIEKVNEIYKNCFKITGLDYGKYIKEDKDNGTDSTN